MKITPIHICTAIIYSLIYSGVNLLNASQSDCKPDISIELDTATQSTEIKPCDLEITEPDMLPVVKFEPEIRTESLIDDEFRRKQESLDQIDAFTSTHRRRAIDNANAHDRKQHSLDNFHLPAYSCSLPKVRQSDNVAEHYDRAKIATLDHAINDFYHCINAAANKDRDAFVQLITGKLGGKIVSRTDNNIKWAVFPEYTAQTQDIMNNINDLYQQRYAGYQLSYATLQDVIKQWNAIETQEYIQSMQ